MAKRRVSFSVKCPEFIPSRYVEKAKKGSKHDHEGGRDRGGSCSSSSSEGEMETDVNIFDPKKDLPEDSNDLRQELPLYQKEHIIRDNLKISVLEKVPESPRIDSHTPKTPKCDQMIGNNPVCASSFRGVASPHIANGGWEGILKSDSLSQDGADKNKNLFATGIQQKNVKDSTNKPKERRHIRQRRRSNSLNGTRFGKLLGGANGLLSPRKSFISTQTISGVGEHGGLSTPRVGDGGFELPALSKVTKIDVAKTNIPSNGEFEHDPSVDNINVAPPPPLDSISSIEINAGAADSVSNSTKRQKV